MRETGGKIRRIVSCLRRESVVARLEDHGESVAYSIGRESALPSHSSWCRSLFHCIKNVIQIPRVGVYRSYC